MGWFDKQIKERKQREQEELACAYWSLATIVNRKTDKTFFSEYKMIDKSRLEVICDYYHVDYVFSDEEELQESHLEQLQNTTGMMYRLVSLKGEWWKELGTPVLASLKNGTCIAILPDIGGRYYYENKRGESIYINKKNADDIMQTAICFYPPLPQKALAPQDIVQFLWKCISKRDKCKLLFAGFIITLLGMITPFITQLLFSQIIPSGQQILVYSVGGFLMGTAVSIFLFEVTKNMLLVGMQCKMETALSAAMFSRVLNLPVDFFKSYSSGDLAERMFCLNGICNIFCTSFMGTGMTAVFSVVYLFQIFTIDKVLLLPCILILLAQIIVAVFGMFGQIEFLRKELSAMTKVQSTVYSMLNGIQKLKVAGCEKRAFSKWLEQYCKEADAKYNPPLLLKMQKALAPALTILGTCYIYWICLNEDVDVSHYVAFHSAFGMISAAILTLTSTMTAFSSVRPIFELAKPIMDAEPQMSALGESEHILSGGIEFNNVSFRYTEEGPNILENLCLKIKPGQYVAIVGKTGCGKSTLLRILLGFETPDKGAVYYDGKDVSRLNPKSLHKQIGVVMQNGKLFSGSIYSNISVSAPTLTMEGAWEAARIAGIDKDIEAMPMGMNTVLSEGSGGISGGQRQRLMIARAVAPKPKILLLDEATSALDNITQKYVADSLSHMKCTRLVIAHRLSTIRDCDRILVLDSGKIIEDGTYEELVSQNGFFAELVQRQQIEPVA